MRQMQNEQVQAAEAFLTELEFAFSKQFESLEGWRAAHEVLRKKVQELNESILRERFDFVSEGQWSDNANYHYAEYLRRTKWYSDKIMRMKSKDGGTIEIKIVLAKYGATEAALSTIAGSILQLAKQVISFRFGKAPILQKARKIGGQSIVELVFEGRNHALHWEEGRPRPRVIAALENLGNYLGITLDPKRNNALKILDSLGWNSSSEVEKDLRILINMEE